MKQWRHIEFAQCVASTMKRMEKSRIEDFSMISHTGASPCLESKITLFGDPTLVLCDRGTGSSCVELMKSEEGTIYTLSLKCPTPKVITKPALPPE